MIPQKLEIITLESGKWTEVKASHNTGSSTIYDIKKWKEPLQSLVAPTQSVKDFFKQGTETAWITATGQGVVYVIYGNAFWKKTCDQASDKWYS